LNRRLGVGVTSADGFDDRTTINLTMAHPEGHRVSCNGHIILHMQFVGVDDADGSDIVKTLGIHILINNRHRRTILHDKAFKEVLIVHCRFLSCRALTFKTRGSATIQSHCTTR
jgi:hypothetical protein